jgi:NitT/TauT family transport system substrate-binding protein
MRSISLILRRILALSALSALVLTACQGNLTGSATNQEPVTIAIVNYPGYGPALVADKLDLFEKHGVNAKVTVISDLFQGIAALGSDSIQMLASTADFTPVIQGTGVDVEDVYVSDIGDGADGLLVPQSVQSMQELKGKTVYLAVGTPSHFIFRVVAAQNGLTSDDVKLVKMEADQAGAAFAAGKVDYAVSWEPWLSKAASERKDGKILFTSHDKPGIIVDTYTVRDQFAKEHPEQVKGIVAALAEASDLFKTDPAKFNALAAEGFGLTPAEYAEQVTAVKFQSLKENVSFFDPSSAHNLPALAQQAVDIYHTDGVIEKDKNVDVSSLHDGSFVRDLQ